MTSLQIGLSKKGQTDKTVAVGRESAFIIIIIIIIIIIVIIFDNARNVFQRRC
jgi:t-SNARE complex subunit (syntaxin)